MWKWNLQWFLQLEQQIAERILIEHHHHSIRKHSIRVLKSFTKLIGFSFAEVLKWPTSQSINSSQDMYIKFLCWVEIHFLIVKTTWFPNINNSVSFSNWSEKIAKLSNNWQSEANDTLNCVYFRSGMWLVSLWKCLRVQQSSLWVLCSCCVSPHSVRERVFFFFSKQVPLHWKYLQLNCWSHIHGCENKDNSVFSYKQNACLQFD